MAENFQLDAEALPTLTPIYPGARPRDPRNVSFEDTPPQRTRVRSASPESVPRRPLDMSRVTTFRGNRQTNSGGRRANNRLIANQFIFLDKQNKNKISTIIIFSV